MKHNNRWKRPDVETSVFLVFFFGMACYYGWRLFALTPWYDELYTYYYFISRGPVYAAIHWPLPNNHVGYSTLSACLLIFGNSAVALRGVSYLCSLAGLVLLFRIGRKLFAPGRAMLPVFLYAGLNIVNNLAVQGRGYALVTFCYLTAIWELLHIVVERRDSVRDYVLFAVSLVAALWAIPSSVYVVVPVCLIGGWTALLQKEYKCLKKLILTSVISALVTLGLYGVLWLAIGSNLLVRTEGSAYYGMGHVAVILHAPFASLKSGVEYMLATPYIQSIPRAGFLGQFKEWLQTLFGTHFSYLSGGNQGVIYAVIFIASVILLVCSIVRRFFNREYALFGGALAADDADTEAEEDSRQRYDRFTEWYLLLTILLLPAFLMIQCTLPYYRVFSFAGVMTALLITWLVQSVTDRFCAGSRLRDGEDRKQPGVKRSSLVNYINITIVIISAVLCLGDFRINSNPYSMREELIQDAYEQAEELLTDTENHLTVAVTDCDQEYLLLYLYGIREGQADAQGGNQIQVVREIEEADLVLIDKYLLGQEYGYRMAPEEWKFYLTREDIPAACLEDEMEPAYENWQFVLYRKKE